MATQKMEVIDFEGTESSTTGDIKYWDGEEWSIKPASTPGFVLTSHGVGSAPTWEDPTP